MRKYELVCVIHPDLDDTSFNGVIDKIKGWISEAGGHADKVEIWGRKRLAYAIKKQIEGQYVLLNISLPPDATLKMEHNLHFLEPILRYMITTID